MSYSLQFHLLPIRDWNLLDIALLLFPQLWLQFHLLPIRDWNCIVIPASSGFVQLQFHLLPIRDWNGDNGEKQKARRELQFHLLPIRDWNINFAKIFNLSYYSLQFHLLPIRDWNFWRSRTADLLKDCNFIYSLLGIETPLALLKLLADLLQFHLLPIRDWNCWASNLETNCHRIAISFTPY